MDLKTYANNSLPPSIGDKIVWNKIVGRLESLYRDEPNYLYTVLDVADKRYSQSYAVQIESQKYQSKIWLSASNFELVKASEAGKKLSEKLTFMCIIEDKVICCFETLEEAKNYAASLIIKNWKLQVVIADVVTVAKVTTPDIKFV